MDLPQYLEDRLENLGYKSVNVTSPALDAYCVETHPITPSITVLSSEEKECKLAKVFIKCFSSSERNSYHFEADLYFANETTFYTKILPNYLQLEQTFRMAINVPFSSVPTCFYADKSCLILEDLIAAGYHSVDIHTSLTFDGARVVLQQLARLHAFSIAMRYHNPSLFAAFVQDLHSTDVTSTPIFIEGVQDALQLAKASFPEGSVYVEKLSSFVLDHSGDLSEQNAVLIHGDLWPTNIWMKVVDDVVESVKFVDFQGCQLATWANDLLMVILIAVDKSVRDERLGDLYECYRTAVCAKLDELSIVDEQQLFATESFKQELQMAARHVMATALVGLPLHLQEEHRSTSSPSDGSTDPVLHYFRELRERKSLKCRNKMLEVLVDVVDYGFLE